MANKLLSNVSIRYVFNVFYKYVASLVQNAFIVYIMKKDIILTVRVDEKMSAIIQTLSRKEDRAVAWTTRKLLEEALQARGLIKGKKKRS